MKYFKCGNEFENAQIPEFCGQKRNEENAERARKVIAEAEAIRAVCPNTSYKCSDLENRYFPDNSTVLEFPNHTHIMSEEIRQHISNLFSFADHVALNTAPDGGISFTFTVLNVWEK